MKRLVVCCDGTWQNSNDSPLTKPPTNVTRLSRSISKTDSQGNIQISYYQTGIGTSDFESSIVGGATGAGLSENIREAYHFLMQNYSRQTHDEIVLLGFSRGSFTARSIASFIDCVGLLTQKGMLYFYPIFQDWENQVKPLKEWTPDPDFPFKGPRPNLYSNSDAYVDKLVQLGYTRKDIKIKAVACYDTVGSLGIPKIGVFSNGVPPEISLDYAFVDTTVPGHVEHAIHALALDELRKPFTPTIWELPDPQPGQTLTQVWFQGAHADVGGGYDDLRPSDITLAWMVSQLAPYVEFNKEVLELQLHDPTVKGKKLLEARGWGLGQIHSEFKGVLGVLGGEMHRTPGQYHRYDHATGKEILDKPLENTNEKIHSSVRIRMGVPGLGLEDSGHYNPASLNGFSLIGATAAPASRPLTLQEINEGQKNIAWQKGDLTLTEEPLTQLEFELLNQFLPRLEPAFLSIVPKQHTVTSTIRTIEDDVRKFVSKIPGFGGH